MKQLIEKFSFIAVRLVVRVSLTGTSELLEPQLLLHLDKEVSKLSNTYISLKCVL